MRLDDIDTDWVLLGYTAPSTVDVVGTGSGGIEELLLRLVEDKVFFGGVRVVSGCSVKFISVYFVGKDVGGMARGNVSFF